MKYTLKALFYGSLGASAGLAALVLSETPSVPSSIPLSPTPSAPFSAHSSPLSLQEAVSSPLESAIINPAVESSLSYAQESISSPDAPYFFFFQNIVSRLEYIRSHASSIQYQKLSKQDCLSIYTPKYTTLWSYDSRRIAVHLGKERDQDLFLFLYTHGETLTHVAYHVGIGPQTMFVGHMDKKSTIHETLRVELMRGQKELVFPLHDTTFFNTCQEFVHFISLYMLPSSQ